MRLWSIHPRHLDAKGLVAAWREGLLARAVLRGETVGYRNHPQLDRFKACADPQIAIDCFLSRLLDEATARGYRFDATKIEYRQCPGGHIPVTDGQVAHEWAHMLAKLAVRDPARHAVSLGLAPYVSPCFVVVPGPVEDWEKARNHLLQP